MTVEYGRNRHVIDQLHNLHEQRKTLLRSEIKLFTVRHSFVDRGGFNALVVDGIHHRDLQSMPGVVRIYPDLELNISQTTTSWGLSRLGNPTALTSTANYRPFYHGCGVDIYVIDTGIDINHVEFQSLPGYPRKVANIYNAYGSVSDNTDGNGHGTFCAGKSPY